jgi:hypothetical protein
MYPVMSTVIVSMEWTVYGMSCKTQCARDSYAAFRQLTFDSPKYHQHQLDSSSLERMPADPDLPDLPRIRDIPQRVSLHQHQIRYHSRLDASSVIEPPNIRRKLSCAPQSLQRLQTSLH